MTQSNIYIYIYIEREREREIMRQNLRTVTHLSVFKRFHPFTEHFQKSKGNMDDLVSDKLKF